jgi:hypothetical protein
MQCTTFAHFPQRRDLNHKYRSDAAPRVGKLISRKVPWRNRCKCQYSCTRHFPSYLALSTTLHKSIHYFTLHHLTTLVHAIYLRHYCKLFATSHLPIHYFHHCNQYQPHHDDVPSTPPYSFQHRASPPDPRIQSRHQPAPQRNPMPL